MASPKQAFLDTYDREHATTLRVLRAYPADQADLRPHPRCRSAREIAWTFVLERAHRRLREGPCRLRRSDPRLERRRAPADGEVLHRAQDHGRVAAARLRVVPLVRRDPPSRAAVGVPARLGRQGALDLRAERGRAVDVRARAAGAGDTGRAAGMP